MRRNHWLFLGLPLFLISLLGGCAEVTKVGTMIGEQTGHLSRQDGESIRRVADQTASAIRPMTEQEENYVGRAVAATLLGKYRICADARLNRYVNEVGQTVALASDRPLTYGGYHFAVLDTEEVNALACPGGIIFITLGMLNRTTNEEELAAVLSHEVAHVNHKDGLASIQKSRWAQVVTTLGSEAARKYSGAELAKLLSLFEGSVNDVAATLLVNGYGREQERAADCSALTFLTRIGYDPYGLTDSLGTLSREQAGGSRPGIFSTHPGMQERLTRARSTIAGNKWTRSDHSPRDQRFREMCGLR